MHSKTFCLVVASVFVVAPAFAELPAPAPSVSPELLLHPKVSSLVKTCEVLFEPKLYGGPNAFVPVGAAPTCESPKIVAQKRKDGTWRTTVTGVFAQSGQSAVSFSLSFNGLPTDPGLGAWSIHSGGMTYDISVTISSRDAQHEVFALRKLTASEVAHGVGAFRIDNPKQTSATATTQTFAGSGIGYFELPLAGTAKTVGLRFDFGPPTP